MRLLKAGLAQLLLVSALGLVSAVPALALELPDVHVLSGETYPAEFVGQLLSLASVGKIETELGEKLTFTGVTIQSELLELSSLGPSFIAFTGVVEPKSKTKCRTATSPEGTVESSAEYHVIDTSTSPLTAAMLFLFKEIVAECNSGKLKVKLRSPVVMKLEKVTSGTDVTSFGLVAKCTGKGKQELKTYLNDAGESVKANLTMNFGLGFEATCVEIFSELTMLTSKMTDFLF